MIGVKAWLKSISLEKYFKVFSSNSIDLDIVTELGEADLIELGLNLGDRRRMLLAIDALRNTQKPSTAGLEESAKELPTPRRIKSQLEGEAQERRQLTLMFVDLIGSTQLSTQLDLEEYRAALHDYQNCCLEAIRANHGHVAQFIGDGVVAYFGYPVVEENDAERAVIAALDICNSISELRLKDGRSLNVRIGISSGDVVVDEDAKLGGLVFGEVPNLAARVQTVADPGTVAVSETTKKLLGMNFAFEEKGKHVLKGFDKPIGIWQVTGFDPTWLRFRSRNVDQVTPLVNREIELTLLNGCLDVALREVGQAVLLSGEAGIGKSRIVEALSEEAIQDNCLRLDFQCSPNHEGSAYYPIITFVSHMAGILRSDSPKRKLAKLKQLLAGWTEEAVKNLALFAGLLSIPHQSDEGNLPLPPDRLKEQLQQTLVNLIFKLAANQPVLLLFEDLHWIDPSTEEIIDLLIERLKAARVLIICTFRPTYHPRWTGQARVTSMSVACLDQNHTLQMLDNLLTTGLVPPEIEEQIARKTEGVPLFLEEMARMIESRFENPDQDVPEKDLLALPSTLKELLRAMIDKLESARSIVPICAAIGRNILPAMVQAVSGRSAKTTDLMLEQLVGAQILVPRGTGQDRSFFFRHSLIQDVAYDLMLPSHARTVHQRIVDVMVKSFKDIAEESPELLAQHYTLAELPSPARDAWQDAAVIASSRSGTEEAIQHLNAALRENAKVVSELEQNHKEIALRKMLNVALNTREFGSKEVLNNFSRLHEVLDKSDVDSSDEFLSLHVQLGAKLMLGDPRSAIALCSGMQNIALQSGGPTMKALTEHNLGMCNFMLGNLEVAIAKFDQALELREHISAEEVLKYHAADIRIVDIAMRCWAAALQGGNDAKIQSDLKAAIAEANTERHEFSRCYGLNILATAYQILGDKDALLDLIEAALEISNKRRFRYWDAWSEILRGWAHARGENPISGIDEISPADRNYASADERTTR